MSGVPLYVPWSATRCVRSRFASPLNVTSSIRSARPTSAAPGSPPATAFARHVMSAVTPKYSCAPPGASRKPVTTSSKIRTTPFSFVSWRSALRNAGFVGTVIERDAAGERRRLGAGHGEAHALGAGHDLADELRPAELDLGARAVVRALRRLLQDGLQHRGMVVAEDHRAVPAPAVDVAVAVDVPL